MGNSTSSNENSDFKTIEKSIINYNNKINSNDENEINSVETLEVGYRVLGVQPNSPASKANMVSFFDFIVSANKKLLYTIDSTFVDLIKVICLIYQ